MTVRVQAFEILRTWLFYTLVKAELHGGSLPFRDVMISGWGLDEQGHKISKRNLVPGPDGTSRYDPADLIARYGADALRHWAGRAALGRDLRFSEKDVRAGRKVVVKLWNASRLVADLLVDFDPTLPRPDLADRPPEDRAVVYALDGVLGTTAAGLAGYDYASGLAALDRWFFGTFCDDWLEAAKDRIRRPERFPGGGRAAAQATAWEVLRSTLGAYAPYLPFVTDGLWAALYRAFEPGPSIHVTRFPGPRGATPVPETALVDEVRAAVRRLRTDGALPQSREVEDLRIAADPALLPILRFLDPTLRAACRATRLEVVAGAPGAPLAVTAAFAPAPER